MEVLCGREVLTARQRLQSELRRFTAVSIHENEMSGCKRCKSTSNPVVVQLKPYRNALVVTTAIEETTYRGLRYHKVEDIKRHGHIDRGGTREGELQSSTTKSDWRRASEPDRDTGRDHSTSSGVRRNVYSDPEDIQTRAQSHRCSCGPS